MHIVTNIIFDENNKVKSVEITDYGTMIKAEYPLSELNYLGKMLNIKNDKLYQGLIFNSNKELKHITSYDITEHITFSEMQEYIKEESIEKENLVTLFINNTYVTLEKIKEVDI